MPWKGHTLAGTTETPYDGDPAEVHARPEEIAYLQETLHHYFPQRRDPLLGSFAGLRVLPHATAPVFRRSRETVLHPDNPGQVRLVTVYGGKLTGYRATAAKVLHLLRKSLPAVKPVADTAETLLSP